MSNDDLREKLRNEIMASYWEDLAPHQARGALLLADAQLDFLEVAAAIAADDTARVAALLREGTLRRVGEPERLALEETKDLRFQFAVVQPWVLAQKLP